MRKIVVVIVVAALLAAGLWWFRGRDGASMGAAGGADAPLAFVPADSPYVFASLEPLPQDVSERWIQQFGASTELWRTQLAMMKADLADGDTPEAATAGKWLDAIEAELDGKTMQQTLQDGGFSLRPSFAMYGIGLAPVVRTELADADKLRAMVARIEQRAGETLQQAKLDDVGYWYVALPDTTLHAIAALQGNHLVLTLGPANDEAALRTLLGIERPGTSLHDGDALVALNRQFGYLPYGSGFVDSRRIVDLLTASATPLETALLAAMKVEKPAVDAACKAEYSLLAGLVPRMSFGYTRLDAGRMDALMRIETHPRIATDLMQLRTPMPGVKAAADSLFDVGLALKAGALPGVLNGWADVAAAQTWACPQLASLAALPDELRTLGSNPGIYTVAPMLSGIRAIATRADFASFQNGAPDASGKLLIASANPAALLSMAQSMAPELAQLALKPDSKVLRVPALAASPVDLPTFAAMSDQVLALGIGADQEATLADDLALDPAYQPLLVYGISGAFYAQIGKLGLTQAALMDDPAARAEAERMAAMLEEIYTKSIKHIDIALEVDEHGLVWVQRMEMP